MNDGHSTGYFLCRLERAKAIQSQHIFLCLLWKFSLSRFTVMRISMVSNFSGINVSGRTSFSTCAECYSHSYNTLCTRPDCGLHGYSAKAAQDPN